MPLNKLHFEGSWQAKMEFLQNNEEYLANQIITMTDFDKALCNVRPSVPKGTIKRYEEWMNLQGSG